jgi:ornithine--oxo-acid transaminase
LPERAARLGALALEGLAALRRSPLVKDVRGRGLLIGIELVEPARPFCERLLERGVLCKETHDHVIRLAPPLVISEEDLYWMIEQVKGVF